MQTEMTDAELDAGFKELVTLTTAKLAHKMVVDPECLQMHGRRLGETGQYMVASILRGLTQPIVETTLETLQIPQGRLGKVLDALLPARWAAKVVRYHPRRVSVQLLLFCPHRNLQGPHTLRSVED